MINLIANKLTTVKVLFVAKKLNYGFVGCGMMGQEHIKNINLIKGSNVAGIFEPDKKMREKASIIAPNASHVESIQELLGIKSLDCVVIASPNNLHLEQFEEIAATHPIPLMIEKPLFTNSADDKRISNVISSYPKPVWVAMEYRYMPPIACLLEKIEQVTDGVSMVSIKEHRFPFLTKVNNWNRFNRNSGGTFVEKCCHFFDLMRLIIQSKPLSVYASGGQDVNHLDEVYNGKKPDIIDNAYVIVNFENGARSLLELCMFAENSDMQEELVATGNKGKIETSVPSDDSGKTSSNIRIGMRDGKTHVENIEVDKKILEAGHHHGSTYYEHLAFLKAIENNSDPEVSLEDGLIAVAVGEAAEQSIKQGRLINLEEIIS